MVARLCVVYPDSAPGVSYRVVPRSFNIADGFGEGSLSLMTPTRLLSGSFDYYIARTELELCTQTLQLAMVRYFDPTYPPSYRGTGVREVLPQDSYRYRTPVGVEG